MAADRTRCIWVYEAKDAQSVRDAYQRAGFNYHRVWLAEALMPGNP